MKNLFQVTNIIRLLDRLVETWNLYLKTSTVRRMRKAVDYGEQFILLTGELEITKEIPNKERKRLNARRSTARKRFFKYNQ